MGRESPIVTVIIANWNGRHWLETCLPALSQQSCRNFEIIVVDNGSEDGSVDWLNEKWPDVRALPQPYNRGFASANNIGIRASSGEFIVTLNNDTLVNPEWLDALVAAVTGPDVGMVASKIIRWDDLGQLDSAGIEIDRSGIAWNRGWGKPVSWAAVSCDVFGPSAAAALYRRTMLEEIGLFDEDFFAYYEDVDLAWRARQAGWRCRYAPRARVRHWHSATAVEGSPFKNRLLGRNKAWTILKNYPVPALFLYLPLILAYDLGSVAVALGQKRDASPLHGRLQALAGFPKMWRQRRCIQRQRRITNREMLQLMKPVVPPANVFRRYRRPG